MIAQVQGLPKVSIGMPVYNGEQYIKEALDSLLAQTFVDFELIISDNASTDNTVSICQAYALRDNRIKFIRQPHNLGAIKNFQFVLDQAVGEFFMWAAHDDTWANDFLMYAMKLLGDETISFVMPSFELRSIHLHIAKKFDMKIFDFITSEDVKYRVLNFMALHYLSHSANIVYSLFRREFLNRALRKQDIGNDGALGVVVLSLGRGMIGHSLFSKRYSLIWPGMLPSIFGIIKGNLYGKDVIDTAQKAIEMAKDKMFLLFPYYRDEIACIYRHYKPYIYDKNYNVCVIDDFFEQELSKCIPKVSIGMPVYNGEQYIKEALDSLLAQTFTNFELIISDNASNDDTAAICKEYVLKDSRIRYIRQDINIGAVANFEFVLNKAVGKYFMWAASDDKWSLNWIETLLSEMSAELNLVSFGEILTIDENSQKMEHLANHRIFDFSGNRLYRRIKYFFQPESLGKANVIYGLFRLDALKKFHFSTFVFDYHMNYAILNVMKIKSNKDVILYKRVHSNNSGEIHDNEKSLVRKSIRFLILPWNQRHMFLTGYWVDSTHLEKSILGGLYLPKVILIYFYGMKNYVRTFFKR